MVRDDDGDTDIEDDEPAYHNHLAIPGKNKQTRENQPNLLEPYMAG